MITNTIVPLVLWPPRSAIENAQNILCSGKKIKPSLTFRMDRLIQDIVDTNDSLLLHDVNLGTAMIAVAAHVVYTESYFCQVKGEVYFSDKAIIEVRLKCHRDSDVRPCIEFRGELERVLPKTLPNH